MSYTFDGSLDYLSCDRIPIGLTNGDAFWCSAWIKLSSVSGYPMVWSVADASATNQYHNLFIWNDYRVTCGSTNVTAAEARLGSPLTSLNAWLNIVGEWRSATDRRAWLQLSSATNTTSKTPSGLDRMAVGVRYDSSPSNGMNGEIAEVVLGSGILSHSDRAALSAGLDPRMFPTMKLMAYWPLESDPNDHSGNRFHLTPVNQATLDSSHPIVQRANPSLWQRNYMPNRARHVQRQLVTHP